MIYKAADRLGGAWRALEEKTCNQRYYIKNHKAKIASKAAAAIACGLLVADFAGVINVGSWREQAMQALSPKLETLGSALNNCAAQAKAGASSIGSTLGGYAHQAKDSVISFFKSAQ